MEKIHVDIDTSKIEEKLEKLQLKIYELNESLEKANALLSELTCGVE